MQLRLLPIWAALALALAACGQSDNPSADTAPSANSEAADDELIMRQSKLQSGNLTGPLVIYSGRHERMIKPVADLFTQKTGVKVVLHSGAAAALLNKMELEGSNGSADVFLSNDAALLALGSSKELFKVLPQELTVPVPVLYRGEKNDWIGVSARARILVANTDVPETSSLSSVWQLAETRWKGKLGITSSSNGSFISGVTVYLDRSNGARVSGWLQGLKSNADGESYAKHSAVVRDVAAGKKAVGLVNHYYVLRHLKENPDAPIRLIMPDQGDNGMGVAWNVAGAAVSKECKNCDSAEAFMEMLIDREGQRVFADSNQEYPVRTDVAANRLLPPASSVKVAAVPMSKLGTERDATLALIKKSGLP